MPPRLTSPARAVPSATPWTLTSFTQNHFDMYRYINNGVGQLARKGRGPWFMPLNTFAQTLGRKLGVSVVIQYWQWLQENRTMLGPIFFSTNEQSTSWGGGGGS